MDEIVNYPVISDYEKKDPGELSLKVGDVVAVLKKGKYIWYGRLNDAKGFFPSKIVDQSCNNEIENPLSSTAVVDNKKNVVADKTGASELLSIESSKSDEPFKEIGTTEVLEDKRRSKPKSPGRPPSQVFIKEYILQKSESMEDLYNTSDEESKEEPEPAPTISTKITAVSQLVMELKQKPGLKSVIQKDTATVEHVTENPVWKKPLIKKKMSVPEPIIKQSENSNTIPPWMEEIRKRREHRNSLKAEDDVLQKVSQEFQENKLNRISVETKSFSKTFSTNHLISEETGNVKTNSVSLETCVETSNIGMTAKETNANRTSSSAGNNQDKNLISTLEETVDTMKKNEPPVVTRAIPQINRISNVSKTDVVNSQSTSHMSTYSCSTKHTQIIKDEKGNLDEIETPNESKVMVTISTTANKTLPSGSKQTSELVAKTQNSDQPKLSVVYSNENQETLKWDNKNGEIQNDIYNEKEPSISVPQSNDNKRIINSIQSVLDIFDKFEAQHKMRSLEILNDIKKLETSFNIQNQETQLFIKAMKVKLSALIEDKH